ncbi:ABC transporter [Paenibacillus selenitireducens]|uniref:ABC transporter n=1 Tax=Paenibacillus selenitireducens TaxID=1324314 RepID=A0A1T2XHM4_9BACL|nr:siderophore ABC transporter substrate-binding protein [Paenibacillus selenitireducens]OPA79389.1 ABC transporter [Paenibacillus selenitireducens]
MKKALLFLVFAMVITVVAACGSKNTSTDSEVSAGTETTQDAKGITVKHQLGETVVPKNPSKVVVFDYGTLDSLDKLGVDVLAVSKDSLPGYLEKFKDAKYENAGGLKEPDFEKINSLKPDLIIISGRQQDSYEELSKIAPTIHLGVDTKRYMESFKENAEILGKIFGKEDAVKEELAKVDETIATVSEKAKSSGKKALIVLANEGKVSAYGAGGRFGLIHDVLGFEQSDSNIEVSTHGKSISFEYIVEKNPDYLFVVDRGAMSGGSGDSSAKQVVENDLVKNTNAFKDGKIVYLDPDYWYLSGGGLTSVPAMVDEVSKSL